MTALYTLVLEGLNRQDLDEADWRTISIQDTNLGPRVQALEPSQKDGLLEAGQCSPSPLPRVQRNAGK